MARRRRGAADFFSGFMEGYNSVGKVLANAEMSDIAKATPEVSTTLNEKNAPDGMTYDSDTGQYIQTGGAASVDAAGGQLPQFDSQTSTTFLGKQTPGTLTPAQEGNARLQAMSGVLGKFGDPMGAARLRAAAGDLATSEQKRADDEQLRKALSGDATAAAVETRRASADAQRSSIGTGADITGAGSTPYTAPTPDDAAANNPPPRPLRTDEMPPASVAMGGLPKQAPAQSQVQVQGQQQPAQTTRPELDTYLKNIAPKALDTLVKQGRLDEAKRFRDFVDSEQGRTYAQEWMNGVRLHAIGDDAGALKSFESLYNRQLYNDGRTVRMTPLDDGKQYRIDQLDTDGKTIVGTKTAPIADLANSAALALEPTKAVEFHAQQQAKRAAESAMLNRQTDLEMLRQQGQESREDRRDERLAMRLDADAEKRAAGGGLSTAQKRSNDSIVAARNQLQGLSADEVLKRTQPTTATGRPNDLYDPQLARTAKLANTRLYGDDPAHDEFTAGKQRQNANALSRDELMKRFRSDRKLDGYTLGKDLHTGKDSNGNEVTGFPVIDKSGTIKGVFQ